MSARLHLNEIQIWDDTKSAKFMHLDAVERTYAWGTKNTAVPFLEESVGGIYEAKRDGHISVTFLAHFELF